MHTSFKYLFYFFLILTAIPISTEENDTQLQEHSISDHFGQLGQLLLTHFNSKQDGQCTYNETLKHVRATIVAVEKQ